MATRRALCATIALALARVGSPTEQTCQRECAQPARQNLCPSSAHPTEHYKPIAREGPGGHFDLRFTSLTFTPCGGEWPAPDPATGLPSMPREQMAFTVRGEPIYELPDNVTNATTSAWLAGDEDADCVATQRACPLPLTSDDNYTAIVLGPRTNGRFRYYGVDYTELFIGSNGFVTLGAGDIRAPNSLKRHFLMPRVSVLFADLGVLPPAHAHHTRKGAVFYELKQMGSRSERLVITYHYVYDVKTGARLEPFQLTLWLNRSEIVFSYLDVNASDAIVGLSPGPAQTGGEFQLTGDVPDSSWHDKLSPGQSYFDQTDLSETAGCLSNVNCTKQTDVRPIGPTRPPWTLPHPYPIAPDPNVHHEYCQLGCTYYFANTTGSSVERCHEMCDWTYRYDVTVGYNDLAEVARYECRDGCEIANLRCQPGYACADKEMRVCEPGSYRDNDYEHTLQCVNCPRGRYRDADGGRYMESCSKCPIGKYVNQTGATHINDCLRCPAGTFAPEPGLAVCMCITPFSCALRWEDLAEMKGSEPFIGRF